MTEAPRSFAVEFAHNGGDVRVWIDGQVFDLSALRRERDAVRSELERIHVELERTRAELAQALRTLRR